MNLLSPFSFLMHCSIFKVQYSLLFELFRVRCEQLLYYTALFASCQLLFFDLNFFIYVSQFTSLQALSRFISFMNSASLPLVFSVFCFENLSSLKALDYLNTKSYVTAIIKYALIYHYSTIAAILLPLSSLCALVLFILRYYRY